VFALSRIKIKGKENAWDKQWALTAVHWNTHDSDHDDEYDRERQAVSSQLPA
jgi:hypothetical protein